MAGIQTKKWSCRIAQKQLFISHEFLHNNQCYYLAHSPCCRLSKESFHLLITVPFRTLIITWLHGSTRITPSNMHCTPLWLFLWWAFQHQSSYSPWFQDRSRGWALAGNHPFGNHDKQKTILASSSSKDSKWLSLQKH